MELKGGYKKHRGVLSVMTTFFVFWHHRVGDYYSKAN